MRSRDLTGIVRLGVMEMKHRRPALSRRTTLFLWIGSTAVLIALMLIGYQLEINLALPVAVLFLLLVTFAGAAQERAQRQAEERSESTNE